MNARLAEQRSRVVGAPNVVMVVLDDLGFAGLGCYGSQIATPNVDRLAEGGLRYNNFHVTPLCSPSRACFLTGRNHHRVGMGSLTERPIDSPGYTGRIPKSAGSLPRLLRDSGYNTFAVGKWHLAPRDEVQPAGPFDRWPLGMGFERFYGFMRGMTDQYAPELARDNGFVEAPSSPENGYHITEDLASQAIRLIQDQQQAAPGKPFFLYFAPSAVHKPHQVPREWIESYRNRFDGGWDVERERRFRSQKELGVVPPDTTLTARPSWVAAWDELSRDEQRVFARQMEVFAGFVEHTDAQIGRLLEFLASAGVLDDTIVIVTSDNGAAGAFAHGDFNFITKSNDVPSMLRRLDDFGGVESSSMYATGWAWAENTPLKLWKMYTWLGGVRVPLVVHWPAGIGESSNGQMRSQFAHAIDLMPTLLETAGVEVPDALDGISQQPLDGRSFRDTFDDPAAPSPRDTQYFEMHGSRSIYHDGWKATTDHVPYGRFKPDEGSRDFDADRWSLFHLDTDFSEAHDVADVNPEKLRQLIELWWYEAGRNEVLLFDRQSRVARATRPLFRDRYVCFSGAGAVETPSPLATGFVFSADIETTEEREEAGVICAHYLRVSGCYSPHAVWACYLIDGCPVVTFDVNGGPQRIRVEEKLPPGKCKLAIAYAPADAGDRSVMISIDHQEVATATGPSISANPRFGMLLIGRDRRAAANGDYRPPFAFTGRIHAAVYEPGGALSGA